MEASLWTRCVRALEAELPEQQFNTWVRPLQAVERAGALKLLAPNRFAVDWINANLLERIGELLREGGNGDVPIVTVEVGARNGNAVTSSTIAPVLPPTKARRTDGMVIGARINPDFTFASFVEGKSNQLARGRGLPGGRKSRPRLQPAFPVRRGRPRQDPSHACHCAHDQGARSRRACGLCSFGALRQRHGERAPAQQHQRVQDGVPLARCAADRRHSVLCRQGSLTGRVLPHVQRAAGRPAPGHPHLRPLSERSGRPGRAIEIALRLGSHGGRRASGARDVRGHSHD